MTKNSKITITNNSTTICINIPINTLIFAQENRPDILYKITDKNKMVEYFKDRFWEFGTDENRGSHIEECIDNFFSDACEYGENWIEMIDGDVEYE
jgi:hypothetical protein